MVEKVKIGPIIYTVSEPKKVTTQDENGVVTEQSAKVSYFKQEIQVRAGLSAVMKASSKVHEVLHAILFQAGHGDHEENMILALEYGLFQFIRENPQFIKEIQEAK